MRHPEVRVSDRDRVQSPRFESPSETRESSRSPRRSTPPTPLVDPLRTCPRGKSPANFLTPVRHCRRTSYRLAAETAGRPDGTKCLICGLPRFRNGRNCFHELLGIEGLLQECCVRPRKESRDQFGTGGSADEDDRELRPSMLDELIESAAAHIRQLHIDDDEIRTRARDFV